MTAVIIICTRNRAAALRATLDALQTLEVPDDLPTELLIADNGSTDDTAAVIADARFNNLPVKSLFEPTPGKANALNRALVATKSDIVLFLDDDVRPVRDWIGRVTAPIREGRADIVAGGITLPPHLSRPWMKGTVADLVGAATAGLDAADPLLAIGANMAMRRAVLQKVPGFDTQIGPGTAYGICEDLLFSLQARQAGFRLVSAFDVTVEHHFDESRLLRAAILRRAVVEGRSRAYIAYHWQHVAVDRPAVFALKRNLRLLQWRLLNRAEAASAEGMTETEMAIRIDIEYFRQLILESRKPRAYPKLGLVKM